MSQLSIYKRVSLPYSTRHLPNKALSWYKQTFDMGRQKNENNGTTRVDQPAPQREQNDFYLSSSTLLKIHALNRGREIIRKKRVLLLKNSTSITPKTYDREKERLPDALPKLRFGNQTKFDRQNIAFTKQTSLVKGYSKGVDALSTLKVQRNRLSKGIWRGFTNTFMRNGAKLRYQTVLRKALTAL